MQKLFNNNRLKNRFAETDHLPGGQVGQIGADNVTFGRVRTQILGYRLQIATADADQPIVLPANSFFWNIYLRSENASTPTVKIGTSNGADDMLSERVLNGSDGIFSPTPIAEETTIYVGISGGEATINCLYIENYF